MMSTNARQMSGVRDHVQSGNFGFSIMPLLLHWSCEGLKKLSPKPPIVILARGPSWSQSVLLDMMAMVELVRNQQVEQDIKRAISLRIAGAKNHGQLLPNGNQELVGDRRSPIRLEAMALDLASRRREAIAFPVAAFRTTKPLVGPSRVGFSSQLQFCDWLSRHCSLRLLSTLRVAGTCTRELAAACCQDHRLTQVRLSPGVNQIEAGVVAGLMSARQGDGLMVTSTNKLSVPGDVGMSPLDATHRFINIRARKQLEQHGNTTKTWPRRR
jgi:hypothetical protein